MSKGTEVAVQYKLPENWDNETAYSFDHLSELVEQVHNSAYSSAVKAINRFATIRNYIIGYYIVEYEQNGSDRAKYGDKLLKRLAERVNTRGINETLLQRHASMPRNPKIAKVFFLAGFIESWGRGYERIRESFDKAHLAMPKFEQVHGWFMATIQREVFMRVQGGNGETESDVIENVIENVIEKRGVKMAQLTKRQLVIIKRLVETGQRYAPGVVIENVPESVLENVTENEIVNNTETLESLATLCGKSTRTIHRDITGLKELGLVRRDGGDLGGIWVVLTSEGGK